jgi:hypothetical protein
MKINCTLKAVPLLKILQIILFVLFLIFIFSLFSGRIFDPDFWWHLKTGQFIYQNGTLPQTDPFSYTSSMKPGSQRISYVLKSNWLAELILYWMFHVFGFHGVIYLRASILTFLIFLLYKAIRREGLMPFFSVVLVTPAVLIFYYGFKGDRPQLFSFLFVFLLVYLIEGFRRYARYIQNQTTGIKNVAIRYLIPIPIVMMIWANLHGGFIVGVILTIIYCSAEIAQYLLKRPGQPLSLRSLKYLIIAGTLSIGASFINPTGYDVLPMLTTLKMSYSSYVNTEWLSPFIFIKAGIYEPQIIIYFILLSLLTFGFLINIKRLDITELSIIVYMTAISLYSTRFIPFFAPLAILLIARYSATLHDLSIKKEKLDLIKKKNSRLLSYVGSASFKILCFTCLDIILILLLIKGDIFKGGVRESEFPVGAARFLKEKRPSGNMFNPSYWGGYLIWALYPDYQVFSDGRCLVWDLGFQEESIMEANSENFAGIPQWQAYLKAYKIDIIITYSIEKYTGRLLPLIPALLNDQEWHLVYISANSLIFLRDSPENGEIIKTFGLPKEWLWNEVIAEKALKGWQVNPLAVKAALAKIATVTAYVGGFPHRYHHVSE